MERKTSFEPFLPIVEVNKVTLETHSDISEQTQEFLANRDVHESLFNKNPHIDLTSRALDITSQGNTTLLRGMLAGSASQKTRVTLELSIAFPSGSPIISDNRLLNMLNIGVLATDSSEYKELMKNPVEVEKKTNSTYNLLALDKKEDLDVVKNEASKKTTYSFKITLPSMFASDVGDLGIITYATLNLPNINLTSQKSGLLVLQGGKMLSESRSFFDKSGTPWIGPVYYGKISANDVEKKIEHLRSLENSDSSNRIERTRYIEAKIHNLENLLAMFSGESFKMLWMTGDGPEPPYEPTRNPNIQKWGNQKPLMEEIVSIPRIQDFRTFNQIEELELNLTHVQNQSLSAIKNNLRNSKIEINGVDTYFSDLFLSRDINNQARFFFSMDWQRVLLDNSVFGKMFEDRSTTFLDMFLDISRIVSFKMFRQRIKGSSEAGSNPKIVPDAQYFMPAYIDDNPFSQNQIDKLLFDTKDSPDSARIVPVYMNSGNQNSVLEITPEQLGLSLDSNNLPTYTLRHFEGIDGSIQNVTDGYYQYRIEIKVLDKGVDVIDNIRTHLNKNLDGIKRYYDEATKIMRTVPAPPSNMGTPYEGGNITNTTKEIYDAGEIQTGNFNSKTNRFTFEFSNTYAPLSDAATNGKLLDKAPSMTPIAGVDLAHSITHSSFGLVQIIKLLSTDEAYTNSNWNHMEQSLLNYLNPWCATPSSINAIIRIMETVSSTLEAMVGVVRSKDRQEQQNADGEITFIGFSESQNPSSKDRSYTLSITPSAIFDANMTHALGFDFLNTTTPISEGLVENGLKNVSISSYRDMAKMQYTRIYNNYENTQNLVPPGGLPHSHIPGDDIMLGNMEGAYFSPHSIKTPHGDVALLGSNYGSNAFLKPVSYSLFDHRTSKNTFLDMSDNSTATSANYNNEIFSNDLVQYFSLYHSCDIVTADIGGSNNNLLGVGAQYPQGNTGLNPSESEGFDDEYYKNLRKHSTEVRSLSYEFYLEALKNSKFLPSHPRNIIKQMPYEYSEFDLSKQNTTASLNISEAVEARKPIDDTQRVNYQSEYLRSVPPQTKALLFQNIIDQPNQPSLADGARNLFTNVQNDAKLYPEFVYRTQIINKMEMLAGFEVGIVKEENTPSLSSNIRYRVLMKQPKWKQITLQNNTLLNTTQDTLMPLCRTIPYINDLCMVRRDPNYNLPTYDEYYHLDIPPSFASSVATTPSTATTTAPSVSYDGATIGNVSVTIGDQ